MSMFSTKQIVDARHFIAEANVMFGISQVAFECGNISGGETYAGKAIASLRDAADALGMELVECDTENYR